MSDALYTLAPASFTLTTSAPAPRAFLAKRSVSRPPVPLPTAMASAPWRFTKAAKSFSARSRWALEPSGYTVVWALNAPSGPRAAHLQPVRMPGSTATTGRAPKGAAIKSCVRFSANTSIAARSARSATSPRVSFSRDG